MHHILAKVTLKVAGAAGRAVRDKVTDTRECAECKQRFPAAQIISARGGDLVCAPCNRVCERRRVLWRLAWMAFLVLPVGAGADLIAHLA